MPAPIIPWLPSNIPSEIQAELNRRKTNRSFNYVQNGVAQWEKDSGAASWNAYKGPMVSWLRVCSNGAGKKHADSSSDTSRFVLYGGKDFYKTYGFQPLGRGLGQQIIGYTPRGTPHIIENSLTTLANETNILGDKINGNHPIHVPTPEISRLEVTIQKELIRKATIEWVCFSWKQLEYMAPYFLIPGISVMIEWGWNHFNVGSLVDLTNVNGKEPNMRSLWNNAYPLYTDNILKSKGNYDVVYGIISNFNWDIQGNKIICSTEVTSKDRLYTGIAKDTSLRANTDKAKKNPNDPPDFLISVNKFLDTTDVLDNIISIARSPDPAVEASTLGGQGSPRGKGGHGINNYVFADIVNQILPANTPTKRLKYPYLHGIFSGRNKVSQDLYGPNPPQGTDFDISGKISPDTTWINMGLIVELLNYFSARPGVNKKVMFEVDITPSIIGAHPNLISCDSRVLIPNYKAPKYHWGNLGHVNASKLKIPNGIVSTLNTLAEITTDIITANVSDVPSDTVQYADNPQSAVYTQPSNAEYLGQYVTPTLGITKADVTLGKYLFQYSVPPPIGTPTGKHVYRNDLDYWINWYRYNRINFGKTDLDSFSFPSYQDYDIPLSTIDPTTGKNKTIKLEKDRSGLLSNIYISFSTLKSVVSDPLINSYWDIYSKLLEIIMVASDEFWDLALTENEGTMTIVDRKYVSYDNIKSQGGDDLWIFDYYDADSLIKSLKFRPALTDAQATRTMYGSNSNSDAKYNVSDKNDLVDFKFKDAVILPEQEAIDGVANSQMERRKSARDQIRSIVEPLQNINDSSKDVFQMTVQEYPIPKGKKEVIKLVMPDQELLRLLLDDEDKANNQRYCAIQPGIVLELTLQGIGGLRTFQYFLIRNLPEPYSHKDVIFRVTDVHQSLEAGHWETTIRAGLVPLTRYITDRVSPPGGWPPDVLEKVK